MQAGIFKLLKPQIGYSWAAGAAAPLCAALIFTGCVASSGSRVPSQSFPPTAPEHVQILYQDPQKPFTVIGYVSIGRSTVANDASVERKFKAVAANMGADAVIIDALPQTPVVGVVVQGKGRAIKWK